MTPSQWHSSCLRPIGPTVPNSIRFDITGALLRKAWQFVQVAILICSTIVLPPHGSHGFPREPYLSTVSFRAGHAGFGLADLTEETKPLHQTASLHWSDLSEITKPGSAFRSYAIAAAF